MTEIRTTSATGGQKGVKPERHSLLPKTGLDAIARVFGFGAGKYEDHNWRRGYEWSKSIDALDRHIKAFNDGQTYDDESGLPHLAHAGFHVLVLLTWLEDQGEGADNPFDDRWPASMERARRDAEAAEEAAAQEEALVDFHLAPGEPGGFGPDLRSKRGVQIHVDAGGQISQMDGAAIVADIERGERQRRLGRLGI